METVLEKPDAQVNMGKWLSNAWDLIFNDLGFFLLITIIYIAIISVASSTIIGEFIVVGPMTVGYFYIIFQKMRGKEVQLGDLSKGFNFFAAAVLSNILITIFVTVGFLFLILPGIVVMALYLFAPAFILEHNMDFWQAMEASRKVATNHLFELSVFVFLLGLILTLGVLACLVGLLIATPLCLAAIAFAYDDLVGLKQEE